MPHYDFQDFVRACGERGKVYVQKDARANAKHDFNLRTEREILEFILNDGLENMRFINSAPWGNNPDPSIPIEVDAYRFSSGTRHGYFAYLFNKHTKKWHIKSFKPDSDPENLPFADDPSLLSLREELEKNMGETDES